jgi:hypothetical protein
VKKNSVVLIVLVLAALAVCSIMASCTTPSIKAPSLLQTHKQESITEEPAVLLPTEEAAETGEPEEKALVFHTEPKIILEETTEPEQAIQPQLAVLPEQPVLMEQPPLEPPPLQAETQPETASSLYTEIPPTETLPTIPPVVAPPVATPPVVAPPVVVNASELASPLLQEQEDPLPQEREPFVIPNMPFQPVSVIPESAEKDLAYSRTVRAVISQYIEIPFRGADWVYLGEFGSRRGINYDSRRMEPEGMTFTFRAEAEGTYSLKFNRQDFIHDHILNDYVKVIVEQPPEITGSSWANPQLRPDRVIAAPRWPTAVNPEGTVRNSTERNTEQSVVTTGGQAATASEVSAPAAAVVPYTDLLKNAQEEYNTGRITGTLKYLDQLMNLYPGGSDEAYWLYGQSLEANNETTRDIRLALDYYRRLVREFPQSNRYDEARRRIVYLERFYFNIQ